MSCRCMQQGTILCSQGGNGGGEKIQGIDETGSTIAFSAVVVVFTNKFR